MVFDDGSASGDPARIDAIFQRRIRDREALARLFEHYASALHLQSTVDIGNLPSVVGGLAMDQRRLALTRVRIALDAISGECYMEDCDAEWYDSTEEYVIEAIQHCETAPHDRVYETAALFVVGSGTCGGGGAACGIYPECAPTFEAVSLDGEVPNSRHIFRVTVTSKQLDYAGGFYSCKDVGVQVTEMDFTKLPEGAPPCDQQ